MGGADAVCVGGRAAAAVQGERRAAHRLVSVDGREGLLCSGRRLPRAGHGEVLHTCFLNE